MEELESQVQANTAVIEVIAPMVKDHDRVIYGDRTNRKDEGMIGTLNNIEEFVISAKSWIKWVAMTLIGALLIGGLKMIIDIALLLKQMNP
jgi:hypothetical protein